MCRNFQAKFRSRFGLRQGFTKSGRNCEILYENEQKPEPKKRNTELHSHEALKSAIKIESSSDFLTKIVHKRFDGTCDSSSESDVEEILSQSTTDSDDNHVQVSAPKRKRITNGFQSMYNEMQF